MRNKELNLFTNYFWIIAESLPFLFLSHPTLLQRSIKTTIKYFSQTQLNKWHCTLLHVWIRKESS